MQHLGFASFVHMIIPTATQPVTVFLVESSQFFALWVLIATPFLPYSFGTTVHMI